MREKKVISKGYDKNHYTEYKRKWEEIEILKPWLRPFPQINKKAYCIMCKRDFVAKLATLKHHATTDTHKENRKIYLNLDDEPLEDIEKDIACAELKLTAYAIVTNQSKLSCNTLVPLMASIFKDSSIAKEIRLDRCRVGEITKRVLAPAHKDRLPSILQKQKFSIIVDESTDISTNHCLAVVVRYVDFDLQKIDERLWSLIHLYSDPLNNETSAEVLFELIMESFQSEDVPTKSIYGYCSDTCNVMMGRNNSVASRFKSYNPQIFINKCQCHIQHLSAKHAYECLPQQFMELLTNIPTYIRASPRRMTMFRWLQKGANLKELKPIYPSMTRNQKKTKAGKEIFALLQQPQTKIYYQFLEFILVKFNKTNASLQSISPIVTNENTRIRNLLLEILEFFINEDYISKYKENLYDIDLKDESQWLPLNSVNIEFLSQGNELMETNENILLLKNEVNITNNNLADYADHDHNYCKMIVDYDSCDNMSVKSGADNNDSEYDSVLSDSILIEQELQEKRFDDENVLLKKSIMNDQVEKVVSFSDNEFENSVLSDLSLFEQELQEKSYIDESFLKEQSIMDDEIEDVILLSDCESEDCAEIDFFERKKTTMLSIFELWPQIDPCVLKNICHENDQGKLEHYMQNTTDSIQATLAKFYLPEYEQFNYKKEKYLILLSFQFCSLKNKQFLNGYVIDSYMMSKKYSGEWKNISFMPTSVTQSILGSDHDKKKKGICWI
uniref:DUF4371 domain-containing protein n=1 Tax=Trichogramma kaykai TaxID=54128 RepID=A0ABD2WP56_9HYME